jgi:hypothetical protein
MSNNKENQMPSESFPRVSIPPITSAIRRTLLVAPVVLATTAAHATSVFINELHYDNAGADTGEAIEIAGPAGTDLTGWSLVLYNGANGTVYNTTALSTVLPNIGSSAYGVTTISYPSNGIQNGSPDGIALVDSTNAVQQFLSYEGSFAAVGGAASGMTSKNIGVSESSSTPAGFSLQLTGTGTKYEDFSWATAGPDTFGAFNFGQTFPASVGGPTELFFSEYVEGTSLNKALEIFNGTGSAIDLAADGYSIEVYFNGSATAGTVVSLTGVVANGDVFVFADDGADAPILAVADQLTTGNLFNGDDAIALLKNGTLVDVIGQIGFDPGSQWGSGLTSTQNNTLRRQPFVFGGDTNGSDPFDPSAEWNGFAQDTFDGLGTHAIAQQTVPEPATLVLMGLGAAGLGYRRRKQNKTA